LLLRSPSLGEAPGGGFFVSQPFARLLRFDVVSAPESTDPQYADNDTPGATYRGWARVGVYLMGLSLPLWVVLPVIPLLPLSTAQKGGAATGLIIVAEVAFWGGAALAGPTAARRMRSWWRSSPKTESD